MQYCSRGLMAGLYILNVTERVRFPSGVHERGKMLVIVHQTNGTIVRMESDDRAQVFAFIKKEKRNSKVDKIYLGVKLVYSKDKG